MSLVNDSGPEFIVQPLYPPRPIQFSVLLAATILSVPCSIFNLYHFLTTRALYKALNNHVVILLIINNALITLIDLPMNLSYYSSGTMWPPGRVYCAFYYFVDFYLFLVSFMLLVWAAIERQILIFHSDLHSTARRRLLIHYVPLGFCCIYPFIYYAAFMCFYPCERFYDPTIANCEVPCYLQDNPFLTVYELVFHGLANMSLVLILNIFLIVRIIVHKRRMGRRMTWSRNRKLAMQLVPMSCLALLTNGGYYTIQFVQLMGDPSFGQGPSAWIYPLCYYLPALLPFVCLSALPDVRQKLEALFLRRRQRIIAPNSLGTRWLKKSAVDENERSHVNVVLYTYIII